MNDDTIIMLQATVSEKYIIINAELFANKTVIVDICATYNCTAFLFTHRPSSLQIKCMVHGAGTFA